ncbi:hypothetical protein QTH98_08905, partial [Variovorax sp. J22G47]|nr:hypothetical protein [Variovorax sp. J22G47]
RELASLKQHAALIRLPLCCSAVPQRPPQRIPPTDVDRKGLHPECADARTTTKPGVRCGLADPFCAAEERSVLRIRARSCLSEASSARPRKTRAPQGSREAAGAAGSDSPYRTPGDPTMGNED